MLAGLVGLVPLRTGAAQVTRELAKLDQLRAALLGQRPVRLLETAQGEREGEGERGEATSPSPAPARVGHE